MERCEGCEQQGDDGEQDERGEDAHHERDGEANRQLPGQRVELTPSVGASVGGEPLEDRRERESVAVGTGQSVDQRVERRPQLGGQGRERVGEPSTAIDVVQHACGRIAQDRREVRMHRS